jgi:hypothetical protein
VRSRSVLSALHEGALIEAKARLDLLELYEQPVKLDHVRMSYLRLGYAANPYEAQARQAASSAEI